MVAEGVERIFDQGGPHLVQFAAIGVDAGQIGLIVALDFDIGHARLEHLQGGVEAGGHIDFEDGGAVHAGVGLDGVDEVEDAGGRVSQGLHRAGGAEIAGKELERDAGFVSADEKSAQLIEVGNGNALLGQLRRDLPGIGAADAGEPGADGVLAGDEGQGIGLVSLAGECGGRLRMVSSQASNALDLLFIEAEVDELEAVAAVGA